MKKNSKRRHGGIRIVNACFLCLARIEPKEPREDWISGEKGPPILFTKKKKKEVKQDIEKQWRKFRNAFKV